MVVKKYHWTTEEIIRFLNEYYGIRLTWWQKLELRWFGLINRYKTYYLFGETLWGFHINNILRGDNEKGDN